MQRRPADVGRLFRHRPRAATSGRRPAFSPQAGHSHVRPTSAGVSATATDQAQPRQPDVGRRSATGPAQSCPPTSAGVYGTGPAQPRPADVDRRFCHRTPVAAHAAEVGRRFRYRPGVSATGPAQSCPPPPRLLPASPQPAQHSHVQLTSVNISATGTRSHVRQRRRPFPPPARRSYVRPTSFGIPVTGPAQRRPADVRPRFRHRSGAATSD